MNKICQTQEIEVGIGKKKCFTPTIQLFLTTIITFTLISIPVIVMLLVALPEAPKPVDHQPTDDYFNVLHISDVHISVTNKEESQKRLRDFCKLLPSLQPDAVVVTGDIVHSRSDTYLPVKHREEYQWYHEIVSECLEQYNTVWYDVRGNHDSDGLYGINDTRNYAKEYYRGNSLFTGVGHVDITKNNSTLRIIGIDMNTHAVISSDGEGFVSSQNVDDIVNAVNSSNAYHLLLGHMDLNRVMTEKRAYVNDQIQKKLGKEKNITAYFCGHIHSYNISISSHGFVTSKVMTLKKHTYKQTLFKNNRFYSQQLGFNEVPIIPVCPADYSANCKQTEVFVGYKVDKVFVRAANGTEFELYENESHRKMWQSTTTFNDKTFTIIVEKDGMNHTRFIEVDKQFTSIHATRMNIRMSRILLWLCVSLTFVYVFRLITGLIAKYWKSMRKVELFSFYSQLSLYEIISSLALLLLFGFVPYVIGTNNIQENGKSIFFYVGLFGAIIGKYHTNFMTYSLGLYAMISCALWFQSWNLCQLRRNHFWRMMYGMVFLCAIIITYTVLIMASTSWLTFFTSPLTYLLLEMYCYCWYHASDIRRRMKGCFNQSCNTSVIKNNSKNRNQMNQLIGESETFDLVEEENDIVISKVEDHISIELKPENTITPQTNDNQSTTIQQ